MKTERLPKNLGNSIPMRAIKCGLQFDMYSNLVSVDAYPLAWRWLDHEREVLLC